MDPLFSLCPWHCWGPGQPPPNGSQWHVDYFELKLLKKWPAQTDEPIYRTETRLTDMESRLVVAKGEGEGVGWTASLGLVDANYYI